ncbi:hypothetical protein TNCV_776331 [Trichonephila clavipes]|nr:hypothetical protein TNCV_776331 [Trichonephila clavipes]
MPVCKCIVPLRHGGTLNNCRAASPLVRLVEGKDRCEASVHPLGGTEKSNLSQALANFFPSLREGHNSNNN